MRPDSPRWREVSDSEFTHERAGLAVVRELLPDRAPYRAYSNFEFRDQQGRWHEVDLLVIGERRLHLVELKHYQGRISGNAYRWLRNGRTEDSPIGLARRKAQRLKSVIAAALREQGWSGQVPFVQQSVFLHAESTRVDLPPGDLTDLYGLPDHERRSGLPSIEQLLLEPAYEAEPMIATDDLLPEVFDRIGMTVRRHRELGSWRLTGPATAEGDSWQDWPAQHREDAKDTARIRVFVNPPGASVSAIDGTAQLVRHEFRLTKRLTHDGLLVPVDIVDHELGTGLVFRTGSDSRRLDLWLAEHADGLDLPARVGLVRQLAEAVSYAHENHVVHRDLSPAAVSVTGSRTGHEPVRAKIGDWRKAGRDDASGTTNVTRVLGVLSRRQDASDDPAAAYRAPEVRFAPDADRIRLDVFGLGALAYLVVTGTPPAAHAMELRQKVAASVGLDLATVIPGIPRPVRELVRRCTHPTVTSRPASMAEVLELLAEAERSVHRSEAGIDPLDAGPDDVLGDRFRVLRRLGKGSTAVGLLVQDAGGEQRVLKVALDDRAASRLQDEADVLTSLAEARSPRLVRLAEPDPVRLGPRTALVLEPAGEQTLADALRQRQRLSIDLLERFGTDLCQALVALDRAGIDHRDIKPANLGVREQPGDRTKHLVLFDFSLARAGAEAMHAGTPPYLDPFLGSGTRQTWDSAAERYAAAVTLYEMATGRLPVYGDGASDPAVIRDEVTLRPEDVDPSLAEALLTFFRRALARNARDRHDTAQTMHDAWRSVFAAAVTTTVPDDGTDAVERARPETPLALSGLTARALSALEPLNLRTVADLVAVPPSSLSSFRGAASATRDEIRARAKLWRGRFGVTVRADDEPDLDPAAPVDVSVDPFGDPRLAAATLVAVGARGTASARQRTLASLLGAGEPVTEPFITVSELALALRGSAGINDVTEIASQLSKAHQAWESDPRCTDLLAAVGARVMEAVDTAGGLAEATRLACELVEDRDEATVRVAQGLVRLALDHPAAVPDGLVRRRFRDAGRGSRMLVATDPALLDAAPDLRQVVERLVSEHQRDGRALVPQSLAAGELQKAWPATVTRPEDVVLIQCAARLAPSVGSSSRGELHHLDLSPAEATRAALGGIARDDMLSRDDVVSRVRARFPALGDLPSGERLDQLVAQADVGLVWQGTGYRNATVRVAGTSLANRPLTQMAPKDPVDRRADEEPFLHSRRAASFLAVVSETSRYDRTAEALAERYGAVPVDLVQMFIDQLRTLAEERGVPWSAVTSADAAPPQTTAARGLATLVAEAVPLVVAHVDGLAAAEPAGHHPVVLVGAGVLARYGHASVVARWADIGARRKQAVWVVVPEVDGVPTLDGDPIGLSYANQLVRTPQSILVESS